jgi:DNA-binding MarR family transcriptional regulator
VLDKFEVYREANDRFNRIVSKLALVEQHPREYGTGELLNRSRIHFIAAIGQEPLITVTKASKLMGITKGAGSQLASRLADEGYISKMRTVGNDKEVRLILTKKGETALATHDEFHRSLFEKFADGTTIDQAKNFNTILKKFEAYADYYLADSRS